MASRKIVVGCISGVQAQAIGDALVLRGFSHGSDNGGQTSAYATYTRHFDRYTGLCVVQVWPELKRFNGVIEPRTGTCGYPEFMDMLEPNAN